MHLAEINFLALFLTKENNILFCRAVLLQMLFLWVIGMNMTLAQGKLC
jgi:hypothetical protein